MMHVSGASGLLRLGYQKAVMLGSWSIEPSNRQSFMFSAKLIWEHPVWSTSRPLDLVLSIGATDWVWRDVSLLRDDEDVYIELLTRPEVTHRAIGGTS